MRFVTPCMMLETRFEVCDSTCDVKTRYVRFVNPCVMLETLVRFVTPCVMLETREVCDSRFDVGDSLCEVCDSMCDVGHSL